MSKVDNAAKAFVAANFAAIVRATLTFLAGFCAGAWIF